MQHPLYRVWKTMKGRCSNPNPNRPGYASYGGRGIRVCERWASSFENFIADMGQRPTGMTLDRIDNDGNYTPTNCRWASRTLQQRNTRVRKDNTSGISGVTWFPRTNRWKARIVVNKKELHLGYFNKLIDAKHAREAAEREYWK